VFGVRAGLVLPFRRVADRASLPANLAARDKLPLRYGRPGSISPCRRPDAAGLMRLVGVRGVSKVFANGVQALSGVSLDVEAAEFLSVLGPSGCGKSTLLRLIAGLIQPTAGSIEWLGARPISALSSRNRP